MGIANTKELIIMGPIIPANFIAWIEKVTNPSGIRSIKPKINEKTKIHLNKNIHLKKNKQRKKQFKHKNTWLQQNNKKLRKQDQIATQNPSSSL